MNQDPIVPKDPQEENIKPEDTGGENSTDIDLDKILLPNKPRPGSTPQSAQRINAGILLEQEQHAELPKAAPGSPDLQPPPPPKDESVVKAVETYQGDIEKVVASKKTSVVSIAAAEASRRSASAIPPEASAPLISPLLMRTLFVMGGVVLLGGALAAIIFVTRPAPTVQVITDAPAPFISVDETKAFTIPSSLLFHMPLLTALESQRENVSISLGLIERVYLGFPSTTTPQGLIPLSAQQLLSILGPNVPDILLRAVNGANYLLAVHAYDGNQPLLILQAESYEQAFSGMLAWEPYMKDDLAPLFVRTPRAHIPEEGVATSSPTSTPAFIQTGFVDRVVENHEARVLQNNTQDILMLWTFLDRNTLVITTNDATLREVITRFKNAPIVPTP